MLPGHKGLLRVAMLSLTGPSCQDLPLIGLDLKSSMQRTAASGGVI
jgi:hypothetical protein